jgi:hypothetical protein
MTQEDYLAHHGTPGQKWGVRNGPPYPLNEQVKKTLKVIAKRNAKKKKEKAKLRAKAEEEAAARNAQKKVDDHERLKQRIRKRPQDFYRYRDLLTKEEANDLIEQIQWDRKIEDIKFDEYKRFNTRMKEISSTITTAATIMNQGINVYNNTALIYNAMIDHQMKHGAIKPEEAQKRKISKVDWGGKDDGNKK